MSTLIQDNSSQVESSGDIVIKDIVYSNDHHISEESVHISHSVLDSTEIQEFSRVTYGTDSSRENGVISFHTLSTDSTTSTKTCLLYTSPSPRDLSTSRMPSSA